MPPAAVTRRAVASRTARMARHVGALHQPLLVHVRVEELVAVGLEAQHRVTARQRQRRLPAVNDHLAALAVDGGDHVLRRSSGEGVGELAVDHHAGSIALRR